MFDALELAKGAIIPWLFHRNGKKITSFRTSWKKACKAAGVPGRLLHDFRRTAVRNLERAGASRSDAMNMVGHKTEAIYRRYAISDEKSLKEAAVKLARLHEADQGTPQKTVQFERSRKDLEKQAREWSPTENLKTLTG